MRVSSQYNFIHWKLLELLKYLGMCVDVSVKSFSTSCCEAILQPVYLNYNRKFEITHFHFGL